MASGIWLLDLGNTRLKCAPLCDDGGIGPVQGIPHDGQAFAPHMADALPLRIEAAYIASVASPALRAALLETLTSRCGRLSLAATTARMAGVTVAYAQPARLGVDRFLTLLAAHARSAAADQRGGPAGTLVVGIGTALTIDLIDAHGQHRGGRIAPSPQLMREALHARAAQLPLDGGGYVEFAGNTADALASGCEGAALALVERSQCEAARLLGASPVVLLHGGGSAVLAAQLPQAVHAPTLVLEGLALWAR